MPNLTLYRADGSCTLVPHCLLTELGIPFTPVRMVFGPNGVEAADGSISHEEYLSINPTGYVPALVADDEIITEMPAVLAYISSLVPQKQLLGNSPLHQAKVLEWTAWLSGSLHSVGYGMKFRPRRFTDNEERFTEIQQKGEEFVRKCYERIEDRLQGRVFPVGDAETVVDYNLLVFWRWGIEIGIAMHELFPAYRKLAKRMVSKASVQKVIEIEGMEATFLHL